MRIGKERNENCQTLEENIRHVNNTFLLTIITTWFSFEMYAEFNEICYTFLCEKNKIYSKLCAIKTGWKTYNIPIAEYKKQLSWE